MEGIRSYQVKRISNEEVTLEEDSIVIEAPLQISINHEAYTVVMRTPGNDIELIRGLLYAEDIYKGQKPLDYNKEPSDVKNHDVVNVLIPEDEIGKGYLNKRTLLSVSSCGICGKQDLESIEVSGDSLKGNHQIQYQHIEKWFLFMKSKQLVFQETGGLHAMMVLNKNGDVLSVKEDIGRHNAMDKAVGDLLETHKIKEAHCLLVSGRVSYEIISKAFFAKIPVVVAVSACSSLAIDFAKEFGICLVGFSRGNKSTIYANPQYISL